MNLTPEDLEAERVLNTINGEPFDEVQNPLGLDRGGSERGVYVLGLRAIARWIRVAVDAAAEILAVRDEIQAGPVLAVAGNSGIVTAEQIAAALELDRKLLLARRQAFFYSRLR